MKKIFLFILLLIPAWVMSQTMTGMIEFEEKIDPRKRMMAERAKFQRDNPNRPERARPERQRPENAQRPGQAPGQGQGQFQNRMPESLSAPKVLYFSQTETIFQQGEEEIEEPDQFSGRGGGRARFFRRMLMSSSESKIYHNLQEGTQVEQRIFFEKPFLIKEDPKTYDWKLTTEQKKIHDYICQKATFQDSTTKIEAWFTPQIPIPSGPAHLGNLPGMILEAVINDGETTYTAKAIKVGDIPEDVLVKPKKGKEVTESEYRDIMRKKMQEMREEMGGRRRFGGGDFRRN